MLNSKVENNLFVEKYRPKILEDYVGNELVKKKVARYIEEGKVPHLLLHGRAGTGKTTLAKIIANETDSGLLYINASDENSVDVIRNKIKNYAQQVSFANYQLIVLDEADYITPNGQAALRNIMESFSKNTRFILTCNFVEKIIDPIRSRCVTFEIYPPKQSEVAKRVKYICDNEAIEYDVRDIAVVVKNNYPDIRRVISSLQQQIEKGKLVLDEASVIEVGYMDNIVEILKSNKDVKQKYKECRQQLADSKLRSFEGLYRHLFEEIDEYLPDGKRAQGILEIAESMNKDAFAVDKEINVTALLIKLISLN